MQRNPVDSSNVSAVGYDPVKCILEVEFGKDCVSGYATNRIYQYLNVPKETYRDFVNFGSYGRFVHQHLGGKFEFIYLGTVEEIE